MSPGIAAITTKVRSVSVLSLVLPALAIVGCGWRVPSQTEDSIRWLAGDHHVHSRYSLEWDTERDPPTPIIGGHAEYPIALNAQMARNYGLSWVVATDHGGRYHSKINLEQAYPDLLRSRDLVPELVQFFGIEMNAPGADHASVIVPHTHDEADRIYELESRFDRRNGRGLPDPTDPGADSEERMIEALRVMRTFAEKPIVIANHPSRTATGTARYGRTAPAELRAWNDSAPEIAIGMIGAPGHQAVSISPDGSMRPTGSRGDYEGPPTLGGFDPMTARLGGFWDSMLGEGRRWWITANSDSHRHWTHGGMDFWPGEYSKTYVYAEDRPAEIFTALRAGRVFVTTGDLISELYVTATATGGFVAGIGGELSFERGADAVVTIQARDPEGENSHGDLPSVNRIDLIAGNVTGPSADAHDDMNPSAYVARRFDERDWSREGELLTMSHRLEDVDRSFYVRVSGTNTDELEPDTDPPGENPWTDLWFYSNPIFLEVE
jgi:hypothetical protein